MKRALALILSVAVLVTAVVMLANLTTVNPPLVVSSQELPSTATSSTAEVQTQNEPLIVPALFGVFSAVVLVKAVSLLIYVRNRNR